MSKTTAQKAHSSTDTDNYGAVVTHTTATIVGRQKAVVNVHAAATDDAQMIVTFNRLMMTFRSAAAVHAFIAGLADARTFIARIDNQAPQPGGPGDDYARAAMSVVWIAPPETAVIPREQYVPARRRTMHWVEVHMGPVIWRIIDRLGYVTMLDELRSVHRMAVAIFTDGDQYSGDPTTLTDAFDDAEREHQEDMAAPWRRRL
ncbi:hypothetical protein CH296_27785 [Rhodococcus sp. 14-2496-1d]|uniref:hypothetical protein n=1 Tax=Rhodococcus sp. 14-2496-1d TaxID=2023146 RepID=UPI000B9AB8B3|nr:hypothetical protein [Rhodococcus sp. 14-2496-1d]OZF25617.1 hypothetical protein CH296_27785 [Rhodococcus sp. 14-2496-1d]